MGTYHVRMRDTIPTLWTDTDDFARIIDEIGKVGDEAVTSPHYGHWRDGYIALQTARASGASHVRLVAEPQPDFVIRVGTDELIYEATELLKPGRRRHDEYRAATELGTLIHHDAEENWITAEGFLTALRNRATSKSEKIYPLGTRLVVYINVGWISSPESICSPLEKMFTLGALRDAVHSASEKFERIDLLHRGVFTTL